MENSNASPLAGETGFGNVAVVGGNSLVESIVVQGLLPCFTEEERIKVIVQEQFRYNRLFVGEGVTLQ